ncbi:MAG: hypothetical protein RL713_1489 [Bacteroidota bacterium]|jgi:hypothetical protein
MSTDKSGVAVDSVTIDNIDDFLPMPGADSIVTSDDDGVKAPANVFSSGTKTADLSFLDNDDADDDSDNPDAKKTVNVDKALAALDEDLENGDDDDVTANKSGRKKVDKSGLIDTFSKLIEEGLIMPFEDDKPLEEYSMKDWKELIQANFEHRENSIKEQTPKEFFESLPGELQYAAEYVARGGTDMKGLFRALAAVEETRSLDVSNPDHQEMIVRQYLQTTNFGNGDQDLIEEQIEEWIEAGSLNKKAQQFKPKLDQKEDEILQMKLAQQEQFRQQQQAQKEAYMANIYHTLKPAELNGVKIDAKRQKFLWDELTTVKYGSMTGKPTNLLGKLLEEYQFGKEPRYDLIAETLWLLSDPDDYKENLRKQAKNEVAAETARKLKTEEARKISSSTRDDEDDDPRPQRRQQGLKKPVNIFKR